MKTDSVANKEGQRSGQRSGQRWERDNDRDKDHDKDGKPNHPVDRTALTARPVTGAVGQEMMAKQSTGLLVRLALLVAFVAQGLFTVLRLEPTAANLNLRLAASLLVTHFALAFAVSAVVVRLSRSDQIPRWSANPFSGILQFFHLGAWSCAIVGALGAALSPIGHAKSLAVTLAFLGIGVGALAGIKIGTRVGAIRKKRNAQPDAGQVSSEAAPSAVPNEPSA